jgi:hypothetical protein
MLTTSSLVCSATVVRVGVACFELVAGRTPPLVGRAFTATMGGTDKGKAQAEFRDDFIALARESTEITWREMRRGVDDLDALTRSRRQPGARPHRPYRYKV